MKSKINYISIKLHTVIVDGKKMKLTAKQIKELKCNELIVIDKQKTYPPISEKTDFYGIIFCEDEMKYILNPPTDVLSAFTTKILNKKLRIVIEEDIEDDKIA